MPSDTEFFVGLQKFVNSKDIIKLYFEAASKKAKFPYGVISDPNSTDLHYGILTYFDINICTNEPNVGYDLETKIQELIELLDGHCFIKEKAVIYFEGKRPVSDPEFELIKRKITFSVRIF